MRINMSHKFKGIFFIHLILSISVKSNDLKHDDDIGDHCAENGSECRDLNAEESTPREWSFQLQLLD